MKITLSHAQTEVVLAALEAFQRFRINQPKTALEAIFPQKCWDLGWEKMQEIVLPLQTAFFPNHPPNGGPGICSKEAGKEAHIAYEIYKQITQYKALKKSDGWFGHTVDFDGGEFLNPSGEKPPEIEGLEEMKYKSFLIPDQNIAKKYFDEKRWDELWEWVSKNMPDLPNGDSIRIIEVDLNADLWKDSRKLYVRVYKPRKKLDGAKF